MQKGFYLGYDASNLGETEIRHQADLLLEKGLYTAGYRVLRLGSIEDKRFTNPAKLTSDLRSQGFQLDIMVNSHTTLENVQGLVDEYGTQMLTIGDSEDKENTRKLAQAFAGRVRIAVCVPRNALDWAAEFANVVILDALTQDADYFEITRNQLDSCRDGDMETARSEANLRARAMAASGVYQVGNLPLKFDYYRNEAIFIQCCMLGCPLILQGDIAAMPDATVNLVRNTRLIRIASLGLGKTARYYDPWHVLLTKRAGENQGYAMVLNRCHGDCPTNILAADLGCNGRFRLWDVMEDRLIGANLEIFEVHVETSDHPETPCCRLYFLEQC